MNPSTSAPFVVALALCGFGCAPREGVVQAPMSSASASASAIVLASNRTKPAPNHGSELPFKAGDRWTGTYLCRQGESDMVILFDDVRSLGGEDEVVEVDVVFEFHFNGNGKVGYVPADGTARMRGKYDVKSRRLRLTAEEWIEQPPNYALVNLVGTVNVAARTYTGAVEGPGCSSFSASAGDGSGDLSP